MNWVKAKLNIILSVIIFVLIGALIFSAVTINKKNEYISSVKSQIEENEGELAEIKKQVEEYEKNISEKDTANADIKAQLEAAKAEKKKLEDENAALKKKIQTLSAEKAKREAEIKANNVATAPQNGNKVCYLTFDDGPSDNTLKILEILKKYNIKATFFVIGNSKTQYIKNIHDAGHTEALHTYSHDYANIYSSEQAYFADLQKISDMVEGITGVKSTIMRFPGGSSNGVSKKYCSGIMTRLTKAVGERGYFYFDWNVSSGDADKSTPSYTYIRNNVLTYSKNKNNVCVLMHDAPAKTTTVQALPEIIDGLIAMGFRFEAITPQTYGFHHQKLNN